MSLPLLLHLPFPSCMPLEPTALSQPQLLCNSTHMRDFVTSMLRGIFTGIMLTAVLVFILHSKQNVQFLESSMDWHQVYLAGQSSISIPPTVPII